MKITRFLTLILAFATAGHAPAWAQSTGNPTTTTGSVVRIDTIQPIAEESSYPYRRLPLKGLFRISRTAPTNESLSVFVHYSGSATPEKDYEALPFFVSIPPGARSVDLYVTAIPDDVAEPIEMVEATLSQCPPDTDPPMGMPCRLVNIDPAHASAGVFIREDGITTANLEITSPKEGAQFNVGATIVIEATAIDLEGAITMVDFYDGATRIGQSRIDFIQQPPPGTPIQHEFQWTQAAAGAHSLTVRATNAAGNAVTSAPVSIQVGGATVPIVSIVATWPETREPFCPPDTCEAPTPAPGVFTLRRTGGNINNSLWVALRIGGTATPDGDYPGLAEVATFPAGRDSVELTVEAFFDELAEGDETVIVEVLPDPSLGPMERYRVDPVHSQARVVIHDRTPPPAVPEVSIVAIDPQAREGTNSAGGIDTATFVIRRTGETNDPLTVFFGVGGTASNGVDYVELQGPVVIPAGQRRVALTVTPTDDRLREYVETVVVKLLPSPQANPLPGYTIGIPSRAGAIILDNDRPRPKCERLADGCFNLCVPVSSNGCFRVEASGDLATWVRLCNIPVNEGAVHFVDPDGADFPRRYYRIAPEPCDSP